MISHLSLQFHPNQMNVRLLFTEIFQVISSFFLIWHYHFSSVSFQHASSSSQRWIEFECSFLPLTAVNRIFSVPGTRMFWERSGENALCFRIYVWTDFTAPQHHSLMGSPPTGLLLILSGLSNQLFLLRQIRCLGFQLLFGYPLGLRLFALLRNHIRKRASSETKPQRGNV